ncbi:MAG: hypothetical protein ACTSWG_04320 [Candidatus Helarchaeota archaeon]
MVIKIGDINIWISRYYSGDMTAYIFTIIILVVLGIIVQHKLKDSSFNKILVFSSFCWFIIEFILQDTGTRTWYTPPTIFNIPIYFPLTAILQGPVEGGIPTSLGYLCAKFGYIKQYYWFIFCLGLSIFFSFVFIFGIGFSSFSQMTVNYRVLNIWSIAFIISTTTIALLISLKLFKNRKFSFIVFFFTAFMGIMINLIMYFSGLRNIEYAIPFDLGTTSTTFFSYPLGIALLALLYDGIFEFGGIYLFIYII